MNTELWILFTQAADGHVTLAGSYEAENDPLPGLRQVLSTCDPEAMNSTVFFVARVREGNNVELHYINPLPSINEAEAAGDGHSDAHCGGCRDGNMSRSEHICEARS